jgi:ribonuclease P protein component
MSKRTTRLTRADFSKISVKYRANGRFFIVAASPLSGGIKFACVVSKKTTPKAHDRNLIRRRVRALFQEIAPKGAMAYIITAKKSANGATFAEIGEDLRCLLVKVGAGLRP